VSAAEAADAALAIFGPIGQLVAPNGHDRGHYAHVYLFSVASSIFGGTDEMQRNILAERVLELPRERA
jgi:alkylation response protein AidB-like acyl-CoA dehydrogenase